MVDRLLAVSPDDLPLPLGRFIARVAWIVLQVGLAYYIGHADVFFYQGF
jgi:uncharacterized BrkB/YihY/UPF0761 family membrane protein